MLEEVSRVALLNDSEETWVGPLMLDGECPYCGRKGVRLYRCVKCGSVSCSHCRGLCPVCGGRKEPI
jgi:hypothetical protein